MGLGLVTAGTTGVDEVCSVGLVEGGSLSDDVVCGSLNGDVVCGLAVAVAVTVVVVAWFPPWPPQI